MSEAPRGRPISRLTVEHFRVLEHVQLEPSPGMNLFFGDNAAGKTSLLEAVSVLSTARSFRSPQITDLIQHGAGGFRVTARLAQADGRTEPVGFQRDPQTTKIRAGGQAVSRMSELTARLPTQMIHPDSHTLVSGGPKQRRRFMDWGVFHVEQGFVEAWRRYDKALKQRNVALKTATDRRSASIWDEQLSAPAAEIHRLRSRHIEALNRVVPDYAKAIVGEHQVEIRYQPGWDTDQVLASVLKQTHQRDRKRGFTCAGPHRAELVFYVDGRPADNYVSRGQQKMLVIALLLAQIALFADQTRRRCVLLVDDLAAELDEHHRANLLGVLRGMDIQILITAVGRDAIDSAQCEELKLFHVEHGRIAEVV